MKKKIQKPFSIEEWKNGAKVETRDGRAVRILTTDIRGGEKPILAAEYDEVSKEDYLHRYTNDGSFYAYCEGQSKLDLVIVKEVEESYLDRIKRSAEAMVKIAELMESDPKYGGAISDEEWKGSVYKFCIYRAEGEARCERICWSYHFLAFHTAEQRDLFLEENERLVKDYLMID